MAKRVLIGDDLLDPSDFLAAEEFKGRDVTLTISGVSRDEVFVPKANQNKKKPVLRFAETPKKLIANKTNQATIMGMYGRQAKDWVGKRITLYPTTCKVGKESGVDCIRVRAKVPPAKGTKPETSPLPPDEPTPPQEPEVDAGAIRAEKGCHPDLPGCSSDVSLVGGRPQCANHAAT